MAKMISMIVLCSTTVVREGERVTPEVGKSFKFTAEEADYIKSVHPAGLRKPVNESSSSDDSDTDQGLQGGGFEEEETAEAAAAAAADAAAKVAGKKPVKAKPAPAADDDL